MPGPTVRNLKRQAGQPGTATTKQPLNAAANSAAVIATSSVLADKPGFPGKPNSQSMSSGAILESGMREMLVREAAYFRAERRGFIPGGELEDWFAAEREVDQALVAGKAIPIGFVG